MFSLDLTHLVTSVLAALVSNIDRIPGFLKGTLELVKGNQEDSTYHVPKQTLKVLPMPGSETWWHMGAKGKEPAMQVVARFYATNLTGTHNLLAMYAKLRKPASMGNASFVVNHKSIDKLEPKCTAMVHVDFWIRPPIKNAGEEFVADVGIVDQWGQEHWIKKVKFRYS